MSLPETTEAQESSAKRSPRIQPYLPLMAVTCIIWGANFPITKPGLADMPPATFALSRFVLSGLVLLPLMFGRRGGWHIARRDWWRVILAGLLGFAVIQLGQNWGLTLSTASDISMLAATEPISIAIMAAYFLGEKPGRAVWLGLFISLLGVLLVLNVNPFTSFAASTPGTGSNRITGDLIFLFSTLGFAAYNVINRDLAQRYDGLETLSGAIIAGIVALLPFSLFELIAGTQPIRLTVPLVFGLLYTSMLVTVFGFLALSWSLKRIPAAKVALLFYLQPLAGVFVAWLGGEDLSWTFGLGAAFILCGVYIAQRRETT